MIGGIYEQDIAAYIIFGIFLNFLFSFLFAMYLSKNIGMEEMARSMGQKRQPLFVKLANFIPFAKMAIILYRVAILQFFFLNRGFSHKEFWVYLTHDDTKNTHSGI